MTMTFYLFSLNKFLFHYSPNTWRFVFIKMTRILKVEFFLSVKILLIFKMYGKNSNCCSSKKNHTLDDDMYMFFFVARMKSWRMITSKKLSGGFSWSVIFCSWCCCCWIFVVNFYQLFELSVWMDEKIRPFTSL